MTKFRMPGVLTTVAALLASSQGFAQQAVVERCRQMSSDADRIACLEAALLEKVAEPSPSSQIDPPSLDIEAAPQGIGASQVIARNATREEAAQLRERAEGLAVASYSTVPYNRLQVTLENGQVWRQIKGDTQEVRVDLRRNQTVDIEESGLGGYKLHLNEMRRTVRVERVK